MTEKLSTTIAARARSLLAEYTPLVRRLARINWRRCPPGVLLEDLVAAGMLGLWDAIRRKGDTAECFEAYALVRVRGAILDELRTQHWLPRKARPNPSAAPGEGQGRPRPVVLHFDDVTEGETLSYLNATSYDETSVFATFMRETLSEAVESLPDRERQIVSARYFRGLTQDALAAELSVSEPRISQLHGAAIRRLKMMIAPERAP